jgi:tRNA (adenine57-N1/adenine58-N1)-methyltransferase
MSLEYGRLITLTDQKARSHTIQLEISKQFFTNHGSISHDEILSAGEGGVVASSNGMLYTVFSPALQDFVVGMPRGAAVIYPKDAAQIIELGDLSQGSKVLEAGVGSGSLTLHILRTIGPSGHLTSCEIRDEFLKVAKKNVEKFTNQVHSNWNLELVDFNDFRSDIKFDCIILDMLNPWDMIENVYRHLRPGGHFVSYLATTTQMSRLVETLKVTNSWTDALASETLYREWHLQGLSVRPKHRMNGHTGFLVHTRRMADGVQVPARRQKPAKGAYGADYQPIQSQEADNPE